MEAQSSRIKHLDGMRGIAILLVLFFHTFVRWPDLLPFVEQTKDVFLFKYGHIGVRFFFIISGFVIFMSLDKTASMAAFFKKRWLRLFPAMFIASIFIFITAHFFHERPAGIPHLINLVPGLAFISPEVIDSIFSVRIEGLEGAFWSLYVEVMFYIFVGVLYFTFSRKVILKSIFITYIFAYSLYIVFHLTSDHPLMQFSVITGIDSYGWFYIGCFMYEKINKRNDYLDNIMMFIVVVTSLYHFDFGLVIITGIIIGGFCFSFYSQTLQRILSNRMLLFFGLISYPLYLIHENMIVSSTIKMLNTFYFGRYEFLAPIPPMIVIFLLSYFISKQERKLKNLLSYIFDKIKLHRKRTA
ncbi:TPA: acyltransferase [Yersinia enterocolitica]|nr:acyltransferase [Yersinia enterocolitica]HDL7343188.1 acyltransferase [Yersinia enterocolitica]